MTVVTNELYERTGTSSPDTENFVNFPLLVGSVKIAAFFRPFKNGGWKVSLRSKGAFDISQVASAFGGGGHRNAAGCVMHTDLADAKEKILEKLKEIS